MKISTRITAFAMGLLAASFVAQAEAPAGYYTSAENKSGRSLLSALHDKIGSHTDVGYKGLLTLYKTSDVYPDGKIWDMYSTKHWNYGTTCGNYSVVGDCYNREHSFPKSWFNDASPMYSDAYHIYPTDGKVNGQRSNYPYGECANGTYLPSHGGVQPLGRLGSCTFPGYSGTVFEPDDEYKGDFARSYFYMAAAYYDRISGWHSDMLAGSQFPAFKTWALNLLLKWHRQDPVSDKERDRNDVVYGRQHNRNPFIDYPELAEHIWGNKSNQAWTPDGTEDPEILLPAEGAAVDFGVTATGHAVTRSITVRTSNAKEAVSVNVSGAGFSASATSIAAASANLAAGAPLTLTYNPTATGSATGMLTIGCDGIVRTVALSGSAVDGLPAGPAKYVSAESFVATWVYVGDDNAGNYTLDVRAGGASIAGYPRGVQAAAGSYTVSELDPSTAYSYTVASRTMTSEPVQVVTGKPVPYIEFLFDGDLFFSATPGEPSEAAELLIDADNIDTDITVTVGEPFELSDNRSDWSTSVTVPVEQGRIYLRLNSSTVGTFSTILKATAGDYTSEGVIVEGTASLTPDFMEDFEPSAEGFGSYNPTDIYHGSAARWMLTDAGIWASDGGYSGSQSVRMGKTAASAITMYEDRTNGIGTVSFMAKYWGTESNPVIAVQVSTDGGQSYTTAGTVTVSGTTYGEYSVFVGATGTARIRLQQTSGKRLNIDDISITRHSSGVAEPEALRHAWDAYGNGNTLTVNIDAESLEVGVYAIDGTTVFAGSLGRGEHDFGPLAPGLYIVAVDDFARRVVIR